MSIFKDRQDAGKKLAQRLQKYVGQPDVLVLALPRGGVPVAFEVAKALSVPLDVFIVRKLGMPGHEEFAMGAIASGGIIVVNERVVQEFWIPRAVIDKVVMREEQELARREDLYRRGREAYKIADKQVILVDDGLATGASMRAAAAAVREMSPAKIIVAVPVAAAETCYEFCKEVDEVFCYATPSDFQAVGNWYQDFTQTTDAEVESLLDSVARNSQAA